jgi:tRNA G18 (ribose-2'-O)-methylase SpoU
VPLIPIDRADDERLAWYRGVGDPELLRQGGRFVAEGRLVVQRLLRSARFETESVLVTPAALERLRDVIDPHLPSLSVHVVALETLVQLTGFNLHRGALAIGRRPEAGRDDLARLRDAAGLLVALEGLANADNVGGIFRSALAFGASGVVLDATTCDPLYRKAIRTSMGATLEVPFARGDDWSSTLRGLREAGVTLLALSPSADAVDIGEAGVVLNHPKLALLIGNEGVGLSAATLDAADARVRIPIAAGVDSLNAATAAGIALYLAGRRNR